MLGQRLGADASAQKDIATAAPATAVQIQSN